MPMPADHVRQMEQAAQAQTHSDPDVQEAGRLLRNPALRRTVDEFHDNPSARQQARGDPTGYFRGRGVQIPSNWRVEFRDNNWSFGFWFGAFSLGYDSDTGWFWSWWW